VSGKIDFISIGKLRIVDFSKEYGNASSGRAILRYPQLLSVRHLRVDLNGGDGLDGGLETYNDLFNQMTHLEILELRLADAEWIYDVSKELPHLSQMLPPTSHLPMLKGLELVDFTAYQDDLIAFLRKHASTLRSLKIEDATFLPDASGLADSPQTASWIKFLEFLRADLKLQRVGFKGVLRKILHGIDCEEWDCDKRRNNTTLGIRLEQFVLYGGPFPNVDEDQHSRPWGQRIGW
jgi:hypothetical protein